MAKQISLIKVKENKKVKIFEISSAGSLRHRLMSMGIYPGKEITKLAHIGLKGPVTIKAGRTIVALGHDMASKITVEIE